MQFEILQESKDDCVWLWGREGREVVLGAVTREVLEDDTSPPQTNLTHAQCVLLAQGNKEILSKVLTAKIKAGYAVTPKPGDRPRVTLRSGDVLAAGVKLSGSVLDAEFRWIDPSTGA